MFYVFLVKYFEQQPKFIKKKGFNRSWYISEYLLFYLAILPVLPPKGASS